MKRTLMMLMILIMGAAAVAQPFGPEKECVDRWETCNVYYREPCGKAGDPCSYCENALRHMGWCQGDIGTCWIDQETADPGQPTAGCGRRVRGLCDDYTCYGGIVQENEFCGTWTGCLE